MDRSVAGLGIHPLTGKWSGWGQEKNRGSITPHCPVKLGARDRIGRQDAYGLGLGFLKAACQGSSSNNTKTWQTRETEKGARLGDQSR